MTARTKALLVVTLGALLAGACGCGDSGASPRRFSWRSWHSCDANGAVTDINGLGLSRFECATLSVPVSYSDPRGAQIPISVIRLVASRPYPIGDIVLNPGGPGGSGVQFLEQAWQTFPESLRARFTLVSFDPRGVGSSEPLQCLTPDGIKARIGLNPAPRTARQIKAVVSADKALVRGCEQNASTAFISSMSTTNTARDMDRLRVALGQVQLTYLGFSYGTYLGTVYAEMFPKRIRAMVLDGAVPPSVDAETGAAQEAAAQETALHDFFAWCVTYHRCGSFSIAPAKSYAALFARFEKGRVITAHLQPEFGGQEPVDYGVAVFGVLAALYSKTSWPILGKALSAAERGDGSYLAALAYFLGGLNPNGAYSNILSASTATECLDETTQTTIREHEEFARRLSKPAPDFGSFAAWSGLTCLYWRDRARTHPAAGAASGAPPLLIIGSTGDPATPYAWAKELAKQLPRSTVLTRTGAGHTAYQFSSCIRKWADRYLETLRMPPAGTICASD